MKKLHPKLAKVKYEENEDSILVYSSGTAPDEGTSEASDNIADPRWEALKNLRKN